MAMENCRLVPLKPRDRIIATARDLFRRHGIRGIGVDAIAEAAGTNKMTLYRHFGSKDELVAECLRSFGREVDTAWNEVEAEHPGDPLSQLHAWIQCGVECVGEGDGRGCDMANAAVELAESDHPARHVIEEFKRDQRRRLAKLCADGGAPDAELLADTLILLFEGARVSRQSSGLEGPWVQFTRSAEAVIAAFTRQSADQKTPKKETPRIARATA